MHRTRNTPVLTAVGHHTEDTKEESTTKQPRNLSVNETLYFVARQNYHNRITDDRACTRLTRHVVRQHTPVFIARRSQLHQYHIFLSAPLPLHQTRPEYLRMFEAPGASFVSRTPTVLGFAIKNTQVCFNVQGTEKTAINDTTYAVPGPHEKRIWGCLSALSRPCDKSAFTYSSLNAYCEYAPN